MAVIDLSQSSQPYVVECVTEGALMYIAAGKKDRFKDDIWTSKNDVTELALQSVSQYMLFMYLVNEAQSGKGEPIDFSYIQDIQGKKRMVSLIMNVQDVEIKQESEDETNV